jgi:hypothetical protein
MALKVSKVGAWNEPMVDIQLQTTLQVSNTTFKILEQNVNVRAQLK